MALAGKSDRGSSQKKVEHFRIFVAPTPGIGVRPALLFSEACNPNYCAAVLSCWFLDSLIKDIADFDWPVMPCAEQPGNRKPGMRADFAVRGCSPRKEKVLDLIQRCLGEVLEESEPEALSDGRIDTVEHRVRARTFDPVGSAIWKEPPMSSCELNACAWPSARSRRLDSTRSENMTYSAIVPGAVRHRQTGVPCMDLRVAR